MRGALGAAMLVGCAPAPARPRPAAIDLPAPRLPVSDDDALSAAHGDDRPVDPPPIVHVRYDGPDEMLDLSCDVGVGRVAIASGGSVRTGVVALRDCLAVRNAAWLVLLSVPCRAPDDARPRVCVRTEGELVGLDRCCVRGASPQFDQLARDFAIVASRAVLARERRR